MKPNKLLTNFLVITTFLAIGFGCKSINIPSISGGGVSESTDPKTAVTTAFKRLMDAKFYHSVVKTKNAQYEVVSEIDYNAPDKYWIKNNLAGVKNEIITAGSDSFMRMNDGKWTKITDQQNISISETRNKMSEESLKSMKDFEFAGTENLNGKDTVTFKFKNSLGGESSSKMWITKEGLPIRIDTEGSISGNSLSLSITYDYEKETKIEAPKVD